MGLRLAVSAQFYDRKGGNRHYGGRAALTLADTSPLAGWMSVAASPTHLRHNCPQYLQTLVVATPCCGMVKAQLLGNVCEAVVD